MRCPSCLSPILPTQHVTPLEQGIHIHGNHSIHPGCVNRKPAYDLLNKCSECFRIVMMIQGARSASTLRKLLRPHRLITRRGPSIHVPQTFRSNLRQQKRSELKDELSKCLDLKMELCQAESGIDVMITFTRTQLQRAVEQTINSLLTERLEEDEIAPLRGTEIQRLVERVINSLSQGIPEEEETISLSGIEIERSANEALNPLFDEIIGENEEDEMDPIEIREIEEGHRKLNKWLQALANELQETGNETLIQDPELKIKLVTTSINVSNPLEILEPFAKMNLFKESENGIFYLGMISELTRGLQSADRSKLITLAENLKKSSNKTVKEMGYLIERRAETIFAPLILTDQQQHFLYKLEQDIEEAKILYVLIDQIKKSPAHLVRKIIEEMRANNQLYLFEKPEYARELLKVITSLENPLGMVACFEGIDLFSPLPREEQLSAHSSLMKKLTQELPK